jgi:hypothetical protein
MILDSLPDTWNRIYFVNFEESERGNRKPRGVENTVREMGRPALRSVGSKPHPLGGQPEDHPLQDGTFPPWRRHWWQLGEGGWELLSWLATTFRELAHDATVLQFPTAEGQILANWIPVFEQQARLF